MKMLFPLLVFCASIAANAASVEFLNLAQLKSLNKSGYVMSNGSAVLMDTLGIAQSYCGTFVDHELPIQYTQPVAENIPYAVNMRNDYSNKAARVFSLHTEDSIGFATGSFYCVAISDKDLSAGAILQKHVGSIIKVTQ